MKLRALWFSAILMGLTLVACSRSAQDEARDVVAQQNHVAVVQTQIALVREQATVEAEATQQTSDALANATAAPVRATATAAARAAEAASLATRTTVQSTATVAAAEVIANAEATRTVRSAQDQAHLADEQGQAAQDAAARQQAWLERCVAAVQVTAPYEATLIANSTSTVEQAKTMAGQNGHYNPYGAVHDSAAALTACNKASH